MESITPMLVPFAILVAGGLLLYFGAEGLVRGSSSFALRRGITPLVVGLTIVAFGTSSPELVVSVGAAIKSSSAIAIGNIVGSNICNIALILGIAALIKPIRVNIKLVKTDIIVMIVVTVVYLLMMLDNGLSRWEGAILFTGILVYTFLTVYLAKKEKNKSIEAGVNVSKKTWIDFVMIGGGLALLVVGATLFLDGAVDIARIFGVPEIVIGLTFVAVGTSLPELATSVVAAIRGEGDISIGNIVGSNIFNILCILGLAALIQPIYLYGVDSTNMVDSIMLILVAIILLPLAWSKLEISRFEGLFLLLIYVAYVVYMYTYRISDIAVPSV